MLRRGLALGAGLLVLVLIVLGVKGCLQRAPEPRPQRLRAQRESDRRGDRTDSKRFFDKLSEPGNASVTEFVAEVKPTAARWTTPLADRRAWHPRRH